MVRLKQLCAALEEQAPLNYQESYDNSGLQVGDPHMEVSGVLISLDVTEEVMDEALRLGFNMILSHHPVIFGGLKALTGRNMAQRIVARAIKEDIAIYSGHTNFDAMAHGVSMKMAERLGLKELKILDPMQGKLKKLAVFVPHSHLDAVRQAMFDAGAGHIGAYDQCSFNLEGKGTFRGLEGTDPHVGTPGSMHQEPEVRVETVVRAHQLGAVLSAMTGAHPYEEVAYDLYSLENKDEGIGMGMVGLLQDPLDEEVFLSFLKERFSAGVIRHTALRGKAVRKVALCGGAGSFLLKKAIASRADVFITGDLKYHQFFDADGRIVLMDIGHYESEQFTRDLFYDLLTKKFPKFAVRLSETVTNPIKYY